MEEVISTVAFGLFRLIVMIAFEGLFLRVFYYIGAIPVWVLSLGRYPTRDPRELNRTNRIIYAFIGIAVTIGLGLIAIYFSEPGALVH